MFCTNCMSSVSECGSDIGCTDKGGFYEETQYQCDACNSFGSVAYVCEDGGIKQVCHGVMLKNHNQA